MSICFNILWWHGWSHLESVRQPECHWIFKLIPMCLSDNFYCAQKAKFKRIVLQMNFEEALITFKSRIPAQQLFAIVCMWGITTLNLSTYKLQYVTLCIYQVSIICILHWCECMHRSPMNHHDSFAILLSLAQSHCIYWQYMANGEMCMRTPNPLSKVKLSDKLGSKI